MRWVFLLASLIRVEVREMMMASLPRKVTMAMRQSFMQNCCSSSRQISHLGSCTWKKYWMTDSLTQWLMESLIFFMQRQNLLGVQAGECGQKLKSRLINRCDLFFLRRKDIIWLTKLGTMFRFSFFHSILKSSFISSMPSFQHFRQVGLITQLGTFSIVRDSEGPSIVSEISVLRVMRGVLDSIRERVQSCSLQSGEQFCWMQEALGMGKGSYVGKENAYELGMKQQIRLLLESKVVDGVQQN